MKTLASQLDNKLSTAVEKIAEMQNKINAVEAAGIPATQAEKLLQGWIDDGADSFKSSAQLRNIFIGDNPSHSQVITSIHHGNSTEITQLLNLLFFVLGDEIKAKLSEVLFSDEPDLLLSDAEKEKKASSLKEKLTSLEIEEEMVIREAELTGNYLERRPDANPEVVLAEL